jgi:type VI secretion system protein ImpJ
MTWQNRVLWTEGMFLQAQHFQQQERFFESQAVDRWASAGAFHWGFSELVLDPAALLAGRLGFQRLTGVLPDGTPFSAPDRDPLPAPIEIPAVVGAETYVLAARQAQPGVVQSNVEEAEDAVGYRYRALELSVSDEHVAAGREAPVQVGRLHLRLLREKDAREGYGTLPLAVVQEKKPDQRVVLDESYIPPILRAQTHARLQSYLNETYALVRARSQSLAGLMGQPGQAGVTEIVDFLMLQVLNRWVAALHHLTTLGTVHPERFFSDLLMLLGDLATFSPSRQVSELPIYDHVNLEESFAPLMRRLREALAVVLERNVIQIELQDRTRGVYTGLIPDKDLQSRAVFVLAISSQLPADVLKDRVLKQVKIGPVKELRDLVNLQLPGVALNALPHVPRALPYHAGFVYFELETRNSDIWTRLDAAGTLAVYALAESFPGIQMELWAIRP